MNNKERVNQKNKEMEYEEAPSGHVKLYDYKEPFMKFEDGYGFEGALLFDGVSDKVQCHLCGKWYDFLGSHIPQEHKMKTREYKEMVGLRQSTALVSEGLREKLVRNGMDKRLRNLCNNQGKKMSEETKEKIRQTLKNKTRETENSNATCPAQLLDRLVKLTEKNGGVVPKSDDIPFHPLLVKTYGSLQEACGLAGIDYTNQDFAVGFRGKIVKPSKHQRIVKNTRGECVEWVREFMKKYKTVPKRKDFVRADNLGMYEKIRLTYGKNSVYKEAQGDMNFQEERSEQTRQQLLNEVRRYAKVVEGRLPSVSDCKRGYLPHHSQYYYHFGNWKNVLKSADLI